MRLTLVLCLLIALVIAYVQCNGRRSCKEPYGKKYFSKLKRHFCKVKEGHYHKDKKVKEGDGTKWTSYMPCTENEDCPEHQVCRKDGWRNRCAYPKAGVCPVLRVRCVSTVCENDYDCPGDEKCCAGGGVCIAPVKRRPCSIFKQRT